MDVPATWVDHRQATLQAVNMLVGFGHQRIALLSRPPEVYFYGKAREGYLAGLKEAAIEPDNALIALCEKTDALSAYLATRRFLQLPQPPTGIVAARDVLAEGACKAIEETGLAVGRDISVIGFDDHSWPQDPPSLTTFREPCYEMGKVAAEMLMDKIVHGCGPVEQRCIESPLILRRSAGPAPAG